MGEIDWDRRALFIAARNDRARRVQQDREEATGQFISPYAQPVVIACLFKTVHGYAHLYGRSGQADPEYFTCAGCGRQVLSPSLHTARTGHKAYSAIWTRYPSPGEERPL